MDKFMKAKQPEPDPELTVRGSFNDFIDTEMEPAGCSSPS
jgi:hypothetical protein